MCGKFILAYLDDTPDCTQKARSNSGNA